MARESAVTYENVGLICAQLQAAGTAPSYPSVAEEHFRQYGTKGSSQIVQRYINQWRIASGKRELAMTSIPGLPEEAGVKLHQLLNEIWNVTLAQAEASLASQRHALEQTEVRHRLAIEEANAQAERAERNALSFQSELRGVQQRFDDLATERALAETRMAKLNATLDERTSAMLSLREEVTRLTTTLESMQSNYAAELSSTALRHEEALSAERAKLNAELERYQAAIEGERRHLMRQTDEIRQAATGRETLLQSQLDLSQVMKDRFEQAANNAREQESYWRGVAEASKEATARAQADTNRLREELSSLQQQLQAFRGRGDIFASVSQAETDYQPVEHLKE